MTNTNSPIQWTDVTWSPIVGCKRVSAGCDHCYAFELHDRRHLAWKRGRWPSAPAQYHQPFSKVQLMPSRLSEPLRWRKPRRVFVDSMADLFHDDVPDEFILDVWATMRAAKQHTFQILTKRPERMRDWVRQWASTPTYSNIWLGVSVEDQRAADERIPLLLQTPAAVRFLSCEPLLGHVNLLPWMSDGPDHAEYNLRAYGRTQPLGWVIVGGESGPHAREMELRWALSLREQCRATGVPLFVKQLGSVAAKTLGLRDRHGGDPLEWPMDLLATLYMRAWPSYPQGSPTSPAEVVAP